MLIIILNKKTFSLYITFETVGESIIINDKKYIKDANSLANEGFIGFFDWLRKDSSTITGIRLCYFEHQGYNQILQSFPFATSCLNYNQCFEILFEGDSYNSELSGDQDFSNNYVFISEDKDYLLTFGIDKLTKAEIDSLLRCQKLIQAAQ